MIPNKSKWLKKVEEEKIKENSLQSIVISDYILEGIICYVLNEPTTIIPNSCLYNYATKLAIIFVNDLITLSQVKHECKTDCCLTSSEPVKQNIINSLESVLTPVYLIL